MMDWLVELYPRAREALAGALPDDWPGLCAVVDEAIGDDGYAEVALPLASCRAVGGDPEAAVPVAAAVLAAETSVRILDDVLDQDRPHELWRTVGVPRAANYAFALQALSMTLLATADLPADRRQRLYDLFAGTFLDIAAGQDADAAAATATVDHYWRTAELRTGAAYGAACAAGALVGTNDDALVEACRRYGHHLGLALQALNDLESVWGEDPKTDLHQAKVTLPVVYALSFEHPDLAELQRLVGSADAAWPVPRVVEILERVDARAFLVWAALQERKEALAALEGLPDDQGKLAFRSYATVLFGDIAELAGDGAPDTPKG